MNEWRVEHDRLEGDLVEAMALQDYDQLERLCVVSTAGIDAPVVDRVGWPASVIGPWEAT